MESVGHQENKRPEYAIKINNSDTIISNANKNIQKFTGYKQLNIIQKIQFQTTKYFELKYGFHYS